MRRHKKSKNKHSRKPTNEGSSSNRPEIENDLLYTVEKSEILGRFLAASRNIKPGEIIIKEKPIAVGPCQDSKPICLGCYNVIDLEDETTFSRCEQCGYPLCSTTCPGIEKTYGHSPEECKLVACSNFKRFKSLKCNKDWGEFTQVVTPLRCLAIKQNDPEMWLTLTDMESHDEIRRNVPSLWINNQRLVVDRIRIDYGLLQFEEDEIHKVCGILEVNAFEVGVSSKKSLRAIFPNAFLFSHDCVPNTSHSDYEDYSLEIRAAVPIEVGSPITVTYTYTLQSTMNRRKHLRDTKFFDCVCQRCKDPTELKTYTGALKCPSCPNGLVLSSSPLDRLAGWNCNNEKCSSPSVSADTVCALMSRLSDELDLIDGNDIKGYETYLVKYDKIFHENHYLRLSALHSLSQLYGKIDGFLINDLSNECLLRKLEICRSLLKVFDKIEPGLSKQRGLLLYEIHAPIMVLINRRLQTNSIQKKELRLQMKEVSRYLEEAIKILSVEPESSDERSMGEAAKLALTSIKNQQEIMNLL